MAFSYDKLWCILIDKGWTKEEFRKMIEASPTTIAAMGKGAGINPKVLARICTTLDCQPGDIMECVPMSSDGTTSSLVIRRGHISYEKLFVRLQEAGWTTYEIRKHKLLGEGSLTGLRHGTGELGGRVIARLCGVLNCQPGDIMEYVPDDDPVRVRGKNSAGHISYQKLFELLKDCGMQKTDLVRTGIVSSSTLAKLAKGEHISTETLINICRFLNCQPENIIEYVVDDEE